MVYYCSSISIMETVTCTIPHIIRFCCRRETEKVRSMEPNQIYSNMLLAYPTGLSNVNSRLKIIHIGLFKVQVLQFLLSQLTMNNSTKKNNASLRVMMNFMAFATMAWIYFM